jgi:hypothetical protein
MSYQSETSPDFLINGCTLPARPAFAALICPVKSTRDAGAHSVFNITNLKSHAAFKERTQVKKF